MFLSFRLLIILQKLLFGQKEQTENKWRDSREKFYKKTRIKLTHVVQVKIENEVCERGVLNKDVIFTDNGQCYMDAI